MLLLKPKQKILTWSLLIKKAISKKYPLKIYSRIAPPVHQFLKSVFAILDAPAMGCTSLDTPVPFNLELEKNFMAKAKLDEMIQKLIFY